MKFNLSWVGGLIGLVLLSVSLAACGGSATSTETDTGETESAAVTEEPAETAATEEPVAAATEVVTEEEAAPANGEAVSEPSAPVASQASCFPIDIPENNLIAAVSTEEWSRGPADAPVTVIEYGDFQ